MFSSTERSISRPVSMRSSGILAIFNLMAADGLPNLRGVLFILTTPRVESRRPKSISESSRCPFPEIPAIPKISFCLTTRLRFFKAGSFLSFKASKFWISSTGRPGSSCFLSISSSNSRPTIRFASSLVLVSAVCSSATT